MSTTNPPQGEKDRRTPLIPLDLIDAPTQRLYLVAIFTLVQAYKFNNFFYSSSSTSFHELWKWITIDLVFIWVVMRLRVPRFDWNWKQRWSLRITIFGLNYFLFGDWTFTASIFIPSYFKNLLTQYYYSTAERSVKLSKVLGSTTKGQQSHFLGGQYTVHILAVSTMILNPLSTTYCRINDPSSSKQRQEPTLIPLLFNNTVPSKITYTLTPLHHHSTSISEPRELTIPVAKLIKLKKHRSIPSSQQHHHQKGNEGEDDEDDDLALAAQWSLSPDHHASTNSKSKHHPLPSSSSSHHRIQSSSGESKPSSQYQINDGSLTIDHLTGDIASSSSSSSFSSDPNDALSMSISSSTQSIYYLPIYESRVLVQVSKVWDQDGVEVKIRRKRSTTTTTSGGGGLGGAGMESYESTKIVDCPQAGFDITSTSSTASSSSSSSIVKRNNHPHQIQERGQRQGLKIEHRCLLDPHSTISHSSSSGSINTYLSSYDVPLGLKVRGEEPLKVEWSVVSEGDKSGSSSNIRKIGGGGGGKESNSKKNRKKIETLDGIVGKHLFEEEQDLQRNDNGMIEVPLNVSLSNVGTTRYQLERIVDRYGNEMIFSSSGNGNDGGGLLKGMNREKLIKVHRPREVMFVGECGTKGGGLGLGDEVQLLVGRKKKLQIRLSENDEEEEEEGGSIIGLKFTPLLSGRSNGGKEVEEGGGWTRQIEAKGSRNVEVEVDQEGRYEIVDVSTPYCPGSVLVPSTCTLVLQPLPTLSTTFTPIHDLCSSPTGLLVSLHLTGIAPFTIHYTLTRRDGHRPSTTRHVHRSSSSRDEFKLEPSLPGEYELRFVRIEDKFYNDVKVVGSEFAKKLKVEEVATARWREKEKTVHSCEGGTVGVEVDLKGSAPWTVEYSVVGGQKSVLVEGIEKSPFHLDVEIPQLVSKQGGQFALSLESVVDKHGCRRPLTSPDLIVDVRRTKPTAKLHGAQGRREVVIREGDEARVPVRLTGEGPWTITYSAPTSSQPVEFKAHQPNVDLLIPSAPSGTYRLLSVRDKFCPGDVEETEWNVRTLARPRLTIDDTNNKSGKKNKGNVVKKRGVCQNQVDSVDLLFEGKAPFKATYSLAKDGHTSDARPHTLQAIQSRASLTLFTAESGRHVYELTGISDSLYTSPSSNGIDSPYKIEQDVWPLPEGHFVHGAKHGFCVQDELASRSQEDLVLELSGQAPFSVELEVREEGRRGSKRFTVPDIKTHRWPVTLPYKLIKPNPHSISIRRIVDAHGCETLLDATGSSPDSSAALVTSSSSDSLTKRKGPSSIVLPVSETATIAPVLPNLDVCVGDLLDFIVQGSPPFTVKYEFEGKHHSVPVKGTKFQRVATEPGTFKVLSVGHGEDQCRSNQVELIKRIHPIPSAKVSTGESIVVDIREGDQTEIVFTFTGTPPFEFTYSRRAPQDRTKDKKVLETHTVTGIEEDTYSILTSQEGTYSVSYIADKYCSYPPKSSNVAGKKST